jgi:hypothetical protein
VYARASGGGGGGGVGDPSNDDGAKLSTPSPPPPARSPFPRAVLPGGRSCTPLITRCYICYDVIQEFDRRVPPR